MILPNGVSFQEYLDSDSAAQMSKAIAMPNLWNTFDFNFGLISKAPYSQYGGLVEAHLAELMDS